MKRIGLVIASLFITSLVAILPATPASAVIPCNGGRVCTYWDTNYGGSMYYYTGPTDYCIEIGEPWDNDISSIVNNTAYPVKFYQFHGCVYGNSESNLPLTISSNHSVANLTNVQGVNFNDRFSSLWIGFGAR